MQILDGVEARGYQVCLAEKGFEDRGLRLGETVIDREGLGIDQVVESVLADEHFLFSTLAR